MFDFLKSKDIRKKETEVHKVGEALFKQVSAARHRISLETEFNERINSMFSAGYMLGFVNEKLNDLFDNKKLMRKYIEEIFSCIFPSSGTKLIDTKLEAYNLGKSLLSSDSKYSNNIDAMQKIKHFELGLLAGGHELSAWEINNNYSPHLLLDYMITGEIGELD